MQFPYITDNASYLKQNIKQSKCRLGDEFELRDSFE